MKDRLGFTTTTLTGFRQNEDLDLLKNPIDLVRENLEGQGYTVEKYTKHLNSYLEVSWNTK